MTAPSVALQSCPRAESPPQCSATVDGCPSLDLAVLNSTLQDPGLQAALEGNTTFGIDSRSSDGAVREISVGDRSFVVGEACSGTTNRSCIDAPPAVAALILQLQLLDVRQLTEEPCASVFPAGATF